MRTNFNNVNGNLIKEKWVWATAGLIDTSLRYSGLHFELHRTEIAQCGVPPLGIIEALDVIKHAGFGLGSRAVRLGRRAFA